MVVIFRFLEGMPENRRWCRQDTQLTIHICAAQLVHKRGTHTALGSRPTRLQNHIVTFVRLKSVQSSGVPSLILGCCLFYLSPRAHHLPHSLFFLPQHKNTHLNRDNMINSENTQHITHMSMFPQSTSCTIKNHSGVKTCRVAETRAQTPTETMAKKMQEEKVEEKVVAKSKPMLTWSRMLR